MSTNLQTQAPTGFNINGLDGVMLTVKGFLDSNITWISDSPGWGDMIWREKDGERQLIPQAYLTNGTYRPLLPDDFQTATMFFVRPASTTVEQFDQGTFSKITTDMSLIFYANLSTIDILKYEKFNYTEDLIHEVRQVLTNLLLQKSAFLNSLTVLNRQNDVLADFDLLNERWDKAPFSLFRFNFNITYDEQCFLV